MIGAAARLVALFAIVATSLAFATTASASTRADATKVAWYLKGDGDVILAVHCTLRTVTSDRHVFCDEGTFHIDRFAVNGQWHTPHACHAHARSPA